MNSSPPPEKLLRGPVTAGAATGVAAARRKRRRETLLWTALVLSAAVAVLLVADQIVGRYQQKVVAAKITARAELERMVLHYLRADLLDVVHTSEGTYRASFSMENVYPEYDMFVMLPHVRIFAQSGTAWKELPATEPPDARWRSGRVVHLNERIAFERIFEVPRDQDWFELLPGFFHVRFDNAMLISPVAQPKYDIMEKDDNYYVHLLPVGADLDQVRRKNQFPKGKVPIFIPMPPH
jgi:hypothetical protein